MCNFCTILLLLIFFSILLLNEIKLSAFHTYSMMDEWTNRNYPAAHRTNPPVNNTQSIYAAAAAAVAAAVADLTKKIQTKHTQLSERILANNVCRVSYNFDNTTISFHDFMCIHIVQNTSIVSAYCTICRAINKKKIIIFSTRKLATISTTTTAKKI